MDIIRFLSGAASLANGVRGLSQAFDSSKEGGQLVETRKSGNVTSKIYEIRRIEDRIHHIRAMIDKGYKDPQIIAYTRKLLSQRDPVTGEWKTPEKNWAAEVVTIFKHLRANVRYVHDPEGLDSYASVRRILEWRAGDCDDMVIALGAMLRSVGYRIMLVVVTTTVAPDWDHIYNQVLVDRTWFALDASMARPPGWELPAQLVKAKRLFPA